MRDFLSCLTSLTYADLWPQAEWRFLLAGGMAQQELSNPAVSWLSERAWQDILALSALPTFNTLATTFSGCMWGFKKIFDSGQPHRSLAETHLAYLPTWQALDKLMVLVLFWLFSYRILYIYIVVLYILLLHCFFTLGVRPQKKRKSQTTVKYQKTVNKKKAVWLWVCGWWGWGLTCSSPKRKRPDSDSVLV